MDLKVSLILATYNRPSFLYLAIRYFLNQSYKNKELIIIDDGNIPLDYSLFNEYNIRYLYLDTRTSLGAKINLGIKNSNGDIIIKFDDDDYYANNFINVMINSIYPINSEKLAVGFLQPFLFLDLKNMTVYKSDSNRCSGATLTFSRHVWEIVKFRNVYQAVDSYFLIDIIRSTKKYQFFSVNDIEVFLQLRHNNNTWRNMPNGITVAEYLKKCVIYKKPANELLPAYEYSQYKHLMNKLTF